MDTHIWALIATLGALLVRVGYALHGVGMARSKNSSGAVMRHLCDLCVTLLTFWAVGYAIMSSDARFLGLNWRSLFGATDHESSAPLVFAGYVLIATGIVPGVLAERARFWPSLATSVLLAGIVIPVAALWHAGWLYNLGLRDSGGAAWLHLPGALAAGVGAYFVGARTGKFNRDGSSTAIPGHSVPLTGLGVFVFLVGLFLVVGMRPGGPAAMNLLLAGAAGGLASVLLGQFRYYKPDIHLTFAGVTGALVAISAGAADVPGAGAVFIGAVAGILVPMSILFIDLIFRLDDPSGGIAVHGVGAIWGVIATPLLTRDYTVGERFKHLGAHLLAILVIAVFTVGFSVGLWVLLKGFTKLRANEADEFDGLDLAEHDIGAYPDFQQNTIKSYHLREM